MKNRFTEKDFNESIVILTDLLLDRFTRSFNETPREPFFHCFFKETRKGIETFGMMRIQAPSKAIACERLMIELCNRVERENNLCAYRAVDDSEVIGVDCTSKRTIVTFNRFHFIQEV